MWDIINSIPAIVRILIIFAAILLTIKAKWSLGNAFLTGAMGLGLIFGLDPFTIAKALFSMLMDLKAISFAMTVGLILVLSHFTVSKNSQNRIFIGISVKIGLVYMVVLN